VVAATPATAVSSTPSFHPTPLHITLRLREWDEAEDASDCTDFSEAEATDEDEWTAVDRLLEEGQQQMVRRAVVANGGGGGGGGGSGGKTPPLY